MIYLKAIILALLEGVTEFVPVSSTGHMIILGDIIQFTGDKEATFKVFIQLGAILAVLVIYFDKFTALLPSSLRRGSGSGELSLSHIFLSTAPILLAGFFARDFIKSYLFNPLTAAFGLVFGGALFIVAEILPVKKRVGSLREISRWQALGVGLAQCLAIWPGMSRSGSTIVGGLALGIKHKPAAEFSFIIAVPVMCAAVAYDLFKSWRFLESSDFGYFALGFAVSFLVAWFSIRWFLKILAKIGLIPFAIYRIALGCVLLWFYLF